LAGEPPEQAFAAKQFVEDLARNGETIIVSDLVAAETYYALQHYYKVPKSEAIKAMVQLLESGLVRPEDNGASLSALKTTLASSKKVGFVDRMIYERYRLHSATMISFERAAARLGQVKVLRA
jgi:predicted nucleic-acid-binding protein